MKRKPDDSRIEWVAPHLIDDQPAGGEEKQECEQPNAETSRVIISLSGAIILFHVRLERALAICLSGGTYFFLLRGPALCRR